METNNSRVDFYVGIITACHRDVTSTAKVPRVENERDLRRIKDRVRLEGLSFLTKTLPKMGKALDRALSSGDPLQWPFSRKRKATQLPVFFGSLISEVFDSSGYERKDANIVVLDGLRQLLYLFYKLELPYRPETVANSVQTFVDVDNQCTLEIEQLAPLPSKILKVAKDIVRRITQDLDLVNILPKHGPGAVSTGQDASGKPDFNRVITLLEKKYPFSEYFCFNYSHLSDDLDKILDLPEVETGTAKLVSVPKDSRGPRLISAEPLENQWIQQGQMTALVTLLESHHLTKGQVNFTDQRINGALALEGSLTQKWCTLDMKEASDRVSVDLVKYLFHDYHYEFFDASRSTHTKLPDGTLHKLKKFAPMGSALCFPVESLVFWSVAVSSIMCTHSLSLKDAAGLVYVYGDDIICRSDHHATIRQHYPSFGLVLNEEKCCLTGTFRESCGVDAYKGVDVTPVKIRAEWSSSLSPVCLPSYVAYSNALWKKGYILTALYIENELKTKVRIPYCQTSQFGGIAYIREGVDTAKENRNCGIRSRYDSDYQILQYCGPSVATPVFRRQPSTWNELQYWWSEQSKTKVFDMYCPKYAERATSLRDQMLELYSSVWNREVTRGTTKGCLSPTSRPLAGDYAVLHRNRLQWSWHRAIN